MNQSQASAIVRRAVTIIAHGEPTIPPGVYGANHAGLRVLLGAAPSGVFRLTIGRLEEKATGFLFEAEWCAGYGSRVRIGQHDDSWIAPFLAHDRPLH